MNFIIYRKNNLIFIMNFIYKNLNFKFYCYQNVLFITNGPAAAWHRNKDLFGLYDHVPEKVKFKIPERSN